MLPLPEYFEDGHSECGTPGKPDQRHNGPGPGVHWNFCFDGGNDLLSLLWQFHCGVPPLLGGLVVSVRNLCHVCHGTGLVLWWGFVSDWKRRLHERDSYLLLLRLVYYTLLQSQASSVHEQHQQGFAAKNPWRQQLTAGNWLPGIHYARRTKRREGKRVNKEEGLQYKAIRLAENSKAEEKARTNSGKWSFHNKCMQTIFNFELRECSSPTNIDNLVHVHSKIKRVKMIFYV